MSQGRPDLTEAPGAQSNQGIGHCPARRDRQHIKQCRLSPAANDLSASAKGSKMDLVWAEDSLDLLLARRVDPRQIELAPRALPNPFVVECDRLVGQRHHHDSATDSIETVREFRNDAGGTCLPNPR